MSGIELKQPKSLQKGDRIAIVSTARSLLKKEIENAIRWCQKNGYEVTVSETVGSESGIFAGSAADRAAELQRLLDNKDIHAIWFARGGYGSIQILPKIDWTAFKNNPKWLIGFSDNTQWLLQACLAGKSMSVHGPMPKTINALSHQHPSFLSLMETVEKGKSPDYQWQADTDSEEISIEGKMLGGNLCTMASMAASLPTRFFKNGILFFEEIDEYIYEIDRSLRNMLNAGLFKDLKGVLVGQLSGIKDNDKAYGQSVEEVIESVFDELNIPVFFGFNAGHEDLNLPLIIGANYRLTRKGKVHSLTMK